MPHSAEASDINRTLITWKQICQGDMSRNAECALSTVWGRVFHTAVVWCLSRDVKAKLLSVKERKCCLLASLLGEEVRVVSVS